VNANLSSGSHGLMHFGRIGGVVARVHFSISLRSRLNFAGDFAVKGFFCFGVKEKSGNSTDVTI
jgi:hypothetical protein